jgi:hypothetical protein
MRPTLLAAYVATNDVAEQARAKYLYAKHAFQQAEAEYDEAKVARNAAIANRSLAYALYVDECEAENLEPHTFDLWTIHGEPEGPLG